MTLLDVAAGMFLFILLIMLGFCISYAVVVFAYKTIDHYRELRDRREL